MNVKAGFTYSLAIFLLCVCGSAARAMFAGPTYAPVERLIANASAYVKENPKKAHGYYVLGRIHYLAFANKASIVGTMKQSKDSPPEIAPDWLLGNFKYHTRRQHAIKLALEEFGYSSVSEIPATNQKKFWDSVRRKLTEQGWEHEKLNEKELVRHAAEAVRNFRKAIELDPKNGLYHLGLASLLEQYVGFLREMDLKAVPEEFRSIILNRARDIYQTAYELSIREDLKHKYLPISGLMSLVGYEASKAYVRLIDADGSISDAEKEKSSKVKKDLKKLEGLRPGAITPIVFSLKEHYSPAELLAPNLQVTFDLDGDGVNELWPWVKPTTGILVWDPDGKGSITSGRQMFGSVTWWLFFTDGYHALDCLDDNRDGRLGGQELAGIYAWFDSNCDGKSVPGELLSLEQLQIVSISTKTSGKENNWPASKSGLTLSNGRTVPTYDWITMPLEPTVKLSRSFEIIE